MIRGSCLCGSVRFELATVQGPFELCHCPRCRKVSGAGYLSTLRIHASSLKLLSGREDIRRCTLPVRDAPPAYAYDFCGRCGSVLPDFEAAAGVEGVIEVPVGLLDDPVDLPVDRHIYVEHRPSWDHHLDQLPTFTGEAIPTPSLPDPTQMAGDVDKTFAGLMKETGVTAFGREGFLCVDGSVWVERCVVDGAPAQSSREEILEKLGATGPG